MSELLGTLIALYAVHRQWKWVRWKRGMGKLMRDVLDAWRPENESPPREYAHRIDWAMIPNQHYTTAELEALGLFRPFA